MLLFSLVVSVKMIHYKKANTLSKSTYIPLCDYFLSLGKGGVFFLFPGQRLFFCTFGKKTSVCVKKLFFFSASGKKKTNFSNECVCRSKLCQEKKNRKKKTVFEKEKKPETSFSTVKTVEG